MLTKNLVQFISVSAFLAYVAVITIYIMKTYSNPNEVFGEFSKNDMIGFGVFWVLFIVGFLGLLFTLMWSNTIKENV